MSSRVWNQLCKWSLIFGVVFAVWGASASESARTTALIMGRSSAAAAEKGEPMTTIGWILLGAAAVCFIIARAVKADEKAKEVK